MQKILTIFGTRPEAIKLAPVLKELSKHPQEFESIIGVTGQHDELLNQVLRLFKIEPDFNLMVMQKDQSLSELTAFILGKIEEKIAEIKPNIILIQGDTTTVFSTALAAFYQKIRIGHVEAGLRTLDKHQPFPEEINRRLTDQMSDLFFAPTQTNRRNLIAEGIDKKKIFVTGNTVVDALTLISSSHDRPNIQGLTRVEGKMILVTAHRRENLGEPLDNIFHGIRRLAGIHPQMHFVYPVHPNPNVRRQAFSILTGPKNIHLIEPVDYLSFICLMKECYVILSDSGGVQEEAPSLNKPLLILRNKTERPEIVEAGGAVLVGSDGDMIVNEVSRLIEDRHYYQKMACIKNPFGDGNAASKIVDILRNSFEEEKEWNSRMCIAS